MKIEDLNATFDNVIIEMFEEEKVENGIVIPDSANNSDCKKGKVLSVGPDVIDLEEENVVIIGPYDGIELIQDGKLYRIMKESEILALVEE